MSANLPRYTLRIPKELLDKIKYVAEFQGRSANKEIEQIIKKHVENFEKAHGEINIE
ncbi:Arc family DNA-binding protein [Tissierella praeacuta]|uniref:Arc family DNA-binding protein n=1 Tax=Tissierella TaxID=41273 RepID=UPI00104D2D9F|nr:MULTISPECIES: Arc family DNA-binding protein [Tissierella]TCU75831.1 Arc-like DNA binding dprotein [Tissierella praeacuta]